MTSLLIDFDKIVKGKNLNVLEEKIAPVPMSNEQLGLVLNVPLTTKETLNKIPKGDARVAYINTKDFVDSIKGFAYIVYSRKKKVCEIMGIRGMLLTNILDITLASIPNDTTLWIGIDIRDPSFDIIVKDYISSGFRDPYICKVSPLGYNFADHGLCMMKINDKDSYNAKKDVEYVLSQFLNNRTGNCEVTVRFDKNTCEYLQKLTQMGSTENGNGTITQKELAGTFRVDKIEDDLTYILVIDRSSTITGKEEGVPIAKGLYNFHTHPREAYENHNTNIGWPSAQDYVGFIASIIAYKTILHVVVSIEGLYVIALTNEWLNGKVVLDMGFKNFILGNYNLCNQKDKGIDWYVKKVNSIGFKGYPVFHLTFLPWDKCTQKMKIPYAKNNNNCFSRQETIDKYKQLYNIK